MQNNPYPYRPSDPSGPSYPPMQQPYPGQQPYPEQQPSYPPYGGYAQPQAQPYYPPQPQQPYYPPQPQQVYYPPQQANPNQTNVIVNTSQKVNTGCAPWVIWLCVGVALVLCAIVAVPVVGAVFMANAVTTGSKSMSSSSTDNTNTYTGSQHHKVGEAVTITAKNETYTMVVNSVQLGKNSDTGKTYLIVDLTANNTGSTVVTPTFIQFQLADANNHISKDDSLAMPSGKHLFGGDIQPGGKNNGVLVFEIQPGQHTFTLTYDAESIGSLGDIYGWDLQV